MPRWVEAVPFASLEEEDPVRFDHEGRSYVLVRTGGRVYALDGLCTHEAADLSEGLVNGHVLECPKHSGRFDVRDGRALRVPARVGLRTYATKTEGGLVYIDIEHGGMTA
jgi:3-phenylpropionate/trans-cinnamate dioxygenase ferredoxin component